MILSRFHSEKPDNSISDIMDILCVEMDTDSVREMMKRLCLQSSSLDIQKKGMEYLYVQGFVEELETMITRNSSSAHPSNRAWGRIYRILLDQLLIRKSHRETIEELDEFETSGAFMTKEPELLFLIEVARAKAYYGLQQYDRLGKIIGTEQQYFSKIEERMLKLYFKARMYEIYVSYHLMRNELIMARKYAYRLLNFTNNPLIHTGLHMQLGLSYTYETYEKGMFHFKQALEITENHEMPAIQYYLKNTLIPFFSAHFEKAENISTPDIGEQAHIELSKGNTDKAIDLLTRLPEKSAFHLYYLGIATKDKGILLKSYNQFIERHSDHFFSRLPMNAMKVIQRQTKEVSTDHIC